MKITIKEQIEREVEITLPCFRKNDNGFLCVESENKGLLVVFYKYDIAPSLCHIAGSEIKKELYNYPIEITEAEFQEALQKYIGEINRLADMSIERAKDVLRSLVPTREQVESI